MTTKGSSAKCSNIGEPGDVQEVAAGREMGGQGHCTKGAGIGGSARGATLNRRQAEREV